MHWSEGFSLPCLTPSYYVASQATYINGSVKGTWYLPDLSTFFLSFHIYISWFPLPRKHASQPTCYVCIARQTCAVPKSWLVTRPTLSQILSLEIIDRRILCSSGTSYAMAKLQSCEYTPVKKSLRSKAWLARKGDRSGLTQIVAAARGSSREN